MLINGKNYIGFLKFGEKEHMEALYNEGLLYVNTFDYFKTLEPALDGRADYYEATEEYYAGDGLENISLTIEYGKQKHTLSRENGWLAAAINTKGYREYSHLYSLSCFDINRIKENKSILDERNFAPTKDYVVVIYDTKTFLERLKAKLLEYKCKCKLGFVEYIDINNYSGEMGFFKKFNEYSYQNEWRFIMSYNSSEPLKIYLGSMLDIAMKPQTKENFYNMSVEIVNTTNL